FERLRGNNPFCRIWEEIPEDLRRSLLAGVVLGDGEIAVCAVTAPPNPVVITTNRIIWRAGFSAHYLWFTELASVTAADSGQTGKLNLSRLELTTNSGEKQLIVTAPGKTLFVLWNLLLKFTRTRSRENDQQ